MFVVEVLVSVVLVLEVELLVVVEIVIAVEALVVDDELDDVALMEALDAVVRKK